MRERILAGLGALALIAVAVVVRVTVFGDDGSSPGRGAAKRPVVACTPDLMPVCDALAGAGRIAPDPPSLDLEQADQPPAGLDGWITWDPAPAIANLDAPSTWPKVTPLGGSPLAVATRGTPSLPEGCVTTALTWDCLAAAAAAGQNVGVGPGTTAESLARLAPLAAALIPDGGDARSIAGRDLRELIDTQVPQSAFGSQLTLIQTRSGTFQFLVGPADLLANKPTLQAFRVTPPATVSVVVAARPGGANPMLSDSKDREAMDDALVGVGVTPGAGRLAGDFTAEMLYVVRQKVG